MTMRKYDNKLCGDSVYKLLALKPATTAEKNSRVRLVLNRRIVKIATVLQRFSDYTILLILRLLFPDYTILAILQLLFNESPIMQFFRFYESPNCRFSLSRHQIKIENHSMNEVKKFTCYRR